MFEADMSRVQALPAEGRDHLFRAVDGIARHGMTDIGHVDADLMGTTGFELHPQVGKITIGVRHEEMRNGVFAVFLGDRHLFAVGGVPSDRRVDRTGIGLKPAVDDRLVLPRKGMAGNLFGERKVGKIVFRHDQQSARILVDPVHDAGTDHAVDTGQRALAVIQQRVDQRAVRIARRRVHDHTLRLVDDQQIVILVADIQRNILRQNVKLLILRNLHHDLVAGAQLVILCHCDSADLHGAVFHDLLDGGARHLRNTVAQKPVDPLPCLRRVNGKDKCVNHELLPSCGGRRVSVRTARKR